MALPTFLARRLLPKSRTHAAATAAPTLSRHCILCHPSPVSTDQPSLLHHQPFHLSAAEVTPGRLTPPFIENMFKRFFCLIGLRTPPLASLTMSEAVLQPNRQRLPPDPAVGMTVEELKKVLRATQIEAARSLLRSVEKSSISYKEFLHFCSKASSAQQAPEIASCLDKSGAVVVLGEVVILHTGQLATDMRTVIAPHFDNGESEELKQMEDAKAAIDKRAAAHVRTEMRLGQVFLMAQTVWFMKLTWDISWDIMEPVCFYLGCIYAIMGYGFYLRTGKEPSFKGIFAARFAAKQKKMMKKQGFDLKRLTELKRSWCGSCPAAAREPMEGLPPMACHRINKDSPFFRGR